MYQFLIPADGLDSKQTEELFREQDEALRRRGHSVALLTEEVMRDGYPLRGILAGSTIVYRGWMLKLSEYKRLNAAVTAAGAHLLTSPELYALTHHLPNWYPILQDYTAETVVVSTPAELFSQIDQLEWSGYFLKDFVKSLKVDGGSIIHNIAQANYWVERMLVYRDELEGGICIRRVEDFLPDSECRYFIVQGTPHAPDSREIPESVQLAAQKIFSPFFTVDTAITTKGNERIVELGDGQVSDIVGWTAKRFAEIWPTCDIPAKHKS